MISICKNQIRFTPTVLVLIMLDDNWIHEFLGILLVYAPNAGKNACLAIGYYIYLNGTVSRARAPRRCVSPTTRF